MKTKILSLAVIFFLCSNLYSQNITNTLGTNGSFIVKYSADTLLKLKQSNGLLEIARNFKLLNTSDSLTGVIYKSSNPFMHNFHASGTYGKNTFLGIDAGNFTMANNSDMFDASYNTGIGENSLSQLTTGFGNTALGTYSMPTNTSGSYNTAIGSNTLFFNTSGSENTALGNTSMYYNLTGRSNTSIGVGSMFTNTTGNYNTSVGFNSLVSNETGSDNTSVGLKSMNYNISGSGNTSLGKHSLLNIVSGNNNTAIGQNAAALLVSGSNNIIIGNNANTTTNSVSNQITLGNNQITSLRCNVQSITSLSDMRDKKNISGLSLGLDFISKLKPRQFRWDKREWYENNISDGSKTEDKLNAGFIAQELDEIQTDENAEWLGLVNKDNPDKIEATYGNLLPVMVKAIQELKEKNEDLERENNILKSRLDAFSELSKTISEMQQHQISLDKELKALQSNEIRSIKY